MMVFEDPDKPASTHVSVWRATFSPAGPGNALFWRSELTGGTPRIYADNPALARWLQEEIIGGNMPYKDLSLPVITAEFSRIGALPWYLTERVVAQDETMEFTWYDFLDPFSGRSDPETGDSHGHSACYVPAKQVRVTLNGRQAKGSPLAREREGYQSTSCFLALAESWVKVR